MTLLTSLGGSPLQEKLREESARSLLATVRASRPGIEAVVGKGCPPLYEQQSDLSTRANAQVFITSGERPRLSQCTFSFPDEDPLYSQDIQAALTQRRTQQLVTPEGVRIAMPIRGGRILAVRKQFSDVSQTVNQVRDAFLKAALVSLAIALMLGLGFSATLSRRLARLRRAALRVMRDGAGSPPPADDGRDEIGDLARAFAAMQTALLRQEEARRAFVATASHELRTPLTSLSGMLELLEEDLRNGGLDLEDARAQVGSAQIELRRLGSLATELLDLSRLDAGTPMRSEPVELGELCRAVAAEMKLRAEAAEILLEVSPPMGPCWARGDPGAIVQILRILLDNALRYSPGGQKVRLEAGYRGDRAYVAVSDRGPGVPAAERELIFERFQRGNRTGGEGGFGLGLAIGRELAERQGGTLLLEETPTGARFVCELPIELPSGGTDDGAVGASAP